MKKNRLMLVLVALLVLSLSGLAAAGMTVSWEWLLDDPDVTAYRYQLNGEAEDGWTVVSGDTDSFTAEGLDPYQTYTLYLQRSYDGVNWSESGTSTAEAMLDGIAAEPAAEEPVPAAEPEAVAEEPVAEPEPAPVAEEEPAVTGPEVITYDVLGYKAVFTIYDGYTILVLPNAVTESDVDGFFAYEAAKYGSYVDGVYYSYTGNEVEITYPETVTRADVKYNLPAFVDDISEYAATLTAPAAAAETAPAEEPAQQPVEIVPLEPVSEEAIVEKMGVTDRFAFSFVPRLGVGYVPGGEVPLSAEVGLGLDFGNILSASDSFGFGLRTDITADFMPSDGWTLPTTGDYFNPALYTGMGSIDLKIMLDVIADNVMDFYLGGGVGYAIASRGGQYAPVLSLNSFGEESSIIDGWFASGIIGLKFYTCDLFSIGVEGYYRYFFPSGKQFISGGLVLGFTL